MKIISNILGFFSGISHPHIDRLAIIKNTAMFNLLDDASLKELVKSSRVKHYPANKLISHEGQQQDDFNIIIDGDLRIFVVDRNNQKVALARLGKGDYFGEITLAGIAHRTRYANVETIEVTTLLQLDAKKMTRLLDSNKRFHDYWVQAGSSKALKLLANMTGIYDEMREIFEQDPNVYVKELRHNETLFNIGDDPDNVYIILEGEIKLYLPIANSHKFNAVILHKGHLLGELAILEHTGRTGTAIAIGHSSLLAISRETFINTLHKHPRLELILAELKRSYELPRKGQVQNFFGKLTFGDPVITSIYKLDDGRTVTSQKYLEQDRFTMTTTAVIYQDHYFYENNDKRIDISVTDQSITAIQAINAFTELPSLCGLLLDKELVTQQQLATFQQTGQIVCKRSNKGQPDEIICTCLCINRQQIQECIDQGILDPLAITIKTGAGSSCGGCEVKILQMLGINPWIGATLSTLTQHNDHITSFKITPKNSDKWVPFKAGQYVILNVKINDVWIERPYTITDMNDNNEVRITIKKEPHGFFSQWLHDNLKRDIEINVSQPRGEFLFDDNSQAALCFAGGVGITPFVSFAKTLTHQDTPKRMHLVYSALTEEDFIFKEEFAQIMKQCNTLTVEYLPTNVTGILTAEKVLEKLVLFSQPDVYICGPAGFVELVQGTLAKTNYDPKKIHTEKFVHAGSA